MIDKEILKNIPMSEPNPIHNSVNNSFNNIHNLDIGTSTSEVDNLILNSNLDDSQIIK